MSRSPSDEKKPSLTKIAARSKQNDVEMNGLDNYLPYVV